MPDLEEMQQLDPDEKTNITLASLERWCEDSGGEFVDRQEGLQGGAYWCDLGGGNKIHVNKRRGLKNEVAFQSPGTRRELGFASDAELAYGDYRNWVETTEATIGLDKEDRVLFEEGPTAEKARLGAKRESEKMTSDPWSYE